jgi:hypothetical protein
MRKIKRKRMIRKYIHGKMIEGKDFVNESFV